MTLKERLNEEMKESMKKKDSEKLSVIRLIKSTIKNEEIARKKELNDEETMEVIQREIKMRKESIEEFRKGGREDLAEKQESEMNLLYEYLPKQADDDEIREIVKGIIAGIPEGKPINIGMVMPGALEKLKGRADGKRISAIARELM